ncbi:hypothetical protein QCA50_006526 [Cerrena zonata]|uniref:Uncharacterized protein n=1 Tax=Cerrena zonata TaxID=2478898 RepID=A0AAW0GBQ9_9APHY
MLKTIFLSSPPSDSGSPPRKAKRAKRKGSRRPSPQPRNGGNPNPSADLTTASETPHQPQSLPATQPSNNGGLSQPADIGSTATPMPPLRPPSSTPSPFLRRDPNVPRNTPHTPHRTTPAFTLPPLPALEADPDIIMSNAGDDPETPPRASVQKLSVKSYADAVKGNKRKATEEGVAKRMEAIQRGLKEKRMEGIEAGLRARAESEKRRDKGKGVDRPIANLPKNSLLPRDPVFGSPSLSRPGTQNLFPNASAPRPTSSNHSTPFPELQLDADDLMAIDEAERDAQDRPAKKNKQSHTTTRSPTTARESTPLLPAEPIASSSRNVANTFPRRPRPAPAVTPQYQILFSHYERLAALQSNNNIANGNPRLHLAPPPVGEDFPMVEGSGPLWLSDNVPDWVLRDWEKLMRNKVFLHVFGMSAHHTHPRHDAVMDQLPTLINDIFETTGINLSRPVLDPGAEHEPTTFLLCTGS